jgi:AsmA protein
MSLPPGASLKGLSAAGTVHWNAAALTFNDGAFTLDGNAADGLLAVIMGERLRVEGTLAFERLDLDPYLRAQEKDAAPTGEALFDWALLKYFDADLRLSAAEISALGMPLGRGGFTITAWNGVVSSEVGELELCGGEAAGRVSLDLSNPRAKASLVGSLSGVAAETCLQPFALEIPVRGLGALKVDISTGGSTREELVRGLAGELKMSAKDGAVPVDFLQFMETDDPAGHGWSRERATPFESLNADCRLSAGHIWCQLFNMKTRRGLISGSGGVDVGQQTLDWDFLIANPVAPLNASELVMETPPRVTIRGSLTQPLIQRANRPTLGDRSTQTGPNKSSASPR